MYTPYVNTSKLVNQPAQKTVSTCLVHSHLKMIFGSPSLLDIPQFFLEMLTPLLCYIHKCLKLLIRLPFYFNRSIYLCWVGSGKLISMDQKYNFLLQLAAFLQSQSCLQQCVTQWSFYFIFDILIVIKTYQQWFWAWALLLYLQWFMSSWCQYFCGVPLSQRWLEIIISKDFLRKKA